MDGIYAFDLWLQQGIQAMSGSGGFTAFMDFMFAFFTFFCEELLLLLLLLIVYWTVNKKTGETLMMAMFMSISVNSILKNIIRRPRPFIKEGYSDKVRFVQIDNFFVNTTGLGRQFSFPSGHAQLAGSFYGTFMLIAKKKWAYIVCPIIIFLVMLSRPYLGVHYPTDVLVGGVLGMGIAFLTVYLANKFFDKRYYIYAALIVLLIINVSVPSLYDPDSLKFLGTAIGALAGIFMDEKYTKFEIDGVVWWKRVLRVVGGVALIMVFKEGLKPLFNLFDVSDIGKDLLGALRYLFVGFAATGLWPLIFTKCKF